MSAKVKISTRWIQQQFEFYTVQQFSSSKLHRLALTLDGREHSSWAIVNFFFISLTERSNNDVDCLLIDRHFPTTSIRIIPCVQNFAFTSFGADSPPDSFCFDSYFVSGVECWIHASTHRRVIMRKLVRIVRKKRKIG